MRADVTVNLNVRQEIKNEWENLRKHDVCFLLTVRPTAPIGDSFLLPFNLLILNLNYLLTFMKFLL